jgi:geranylgeranyl reductase family protein
MNETAEITVVGGGPSGLYLANLLAKKGISVTVIEQHKTIGKPVQCAGLITPRVFEQFNIPSENIIQNSISTAHIHSPQDNILTIGGNKIHAYSINRTQFDQTLADQAEQNGAKIITQEKVQSIQHVESHIETCTNKKRNIHSSLIVGADGPQSLVRDIFCFPSPQKFLRGIGAKLTNTNIDPATVEIFVGNKITPDFFAWIIPTNNKGTTARAGLCVPFDKTPKKYFDNFLKNSLTKSYLGKAKIKEQMAGIIPLGALKQTVDDRVLLVGDAAAQVKPTSGGGIFTGLTCAQLAAQTIHQAVQTQDYSKQVLSKYHSQWKKVIGRELSIGMKLHGLYATSTDQQFDKYVTKFSTPALNKTINEHGDIDYPSKLIKPMLKHTPSLLKLIPGLLHVKK